MAGENIVVSNSKEELLVPLATLLAKTAAAAVERHDKFVVAVSGGSMPTLLEQAIDRAVSDGQALHLNKWVMCFADERNVPLDAEDSNYAAYRPLLTKEYASDVTVVPINPDLPSAAEVAEDYSRKVLEHLPRSGENPPQFDLILLGIGPDGHTASLFPGHPLLDERERWVAPISDSPKPPPERVTLTLPVLCAANNVTFIVTGESKASAVNRIMDKKDPEPLPAARVKPADGTLTWLLDADAARDVKARLDS